MLKRIIPVLIILFANHAMCHAQQHQHVNDTVRIVMRDGYTGNGPLYTLDGKIVSKEVVDTLKHETIERIDVLKEGAILKYGTMGENGAVEITTKRKSVFTTSKHPEL